MDAFYVSVELQRRPELRGKPVVVAGSSPRAVVTTASYEARQFGIFSATPAERARRLCPEAIFVAPDFESYRARSRELMAVLRAHVERVEVVGLDEAYLDLTGFERPRAAARRVKAAIARGDGPLLLDRHRAEQAGGQGGLRRREARRLRGAQRASRPASASRARRPAWCPASGPRPPRGSSARASPPSAGSPRHRRMRWRAGSALALGPIWAGWRASRTTARSRPSTRPSRSRARPPSTATCAAWPSWSPSCGVLTEQLCATLAKHERRGRTIGIKVRYDDFSIVTRARSLAAPVNELDTVWEVALRPPAPPRAAAAGAPDRRARGRPGRGGATCRGRGPDHARADLH